MRYFGLAEPMVPQKLRVLAAILELSTFSVETLVACCGVSPATARALLARIKPCLAKANQDAAVSYVLTPQGREELLLEVRELRGAVDPTEGNSEALSTLALIRALLGQAMELHTSAQQRPLLSQVRFLIKVSRDRRVRGMGEALLEWATFKMERKESKVRSSKPSPLYTSTDQLEKRLHAELLLH